MKSRRWLPLILGCVIFTAVLAWIKVAQIQRGIAIGKSFGEPMEVVELAIAEQVQWQPRLSVTADVKAIQSLDLTNELGGRIMELGFTAGSEVKKGQLLVRLDTREEEAQLAAARAEAELARLDLDRNLALARKGVASKETIDKAQAQRQSAEALENRLQVVIDKKNIRAPFDGVAGIYNLEVGEYLQANTLITRLVGNLDDVWLEFNLPQQKAGLQEGDLIGLLPLQNVPNDVTATIVAKDSRVNPRSGNLRYRAIVKQARGQLFPGAVVTVSVPVGEPESVIRLPMTALRYDAFGANVYVLETAEPGAAAEYRASKRVVTAGLASGQWVIVRSGLDAGEKVAANGAFKLRDGLLVKAVAAKIPAGDGDAALSTGNAAENSGADL